MAPNDDVERPRASSAAERQKSIVSMTEFEGMDEYTALQKYILFYRDARTNPHAEQTVKTKKWWQFWKSGSTTGPAVADAGAVPDDCKSYLPNPHSSITSPARTVASLGLAPHQPCAPASAAFANSSLLSFTAAFRCLAFAVWPALKLMPASDAMAAGAVGPVLQADSTKPPATGHAR